MKMFSYWKAQTKGVGREHLRFGDLCDAAENLFKYHDDEHLDEEVCQTPTGVALRDTQHTSQHNAVWTVYKRSPTSSSLCPAVRA